MGQQQTLLLVLAVAIVGTAIVDGVSVFSENMSSANYDALLEDMVRIAGDAQMWKIKPELMGGSPDAGKSTLANFMGLNFSTMGYSTSKVYGDGAECYSNINGEYELIGFFGGLAILARNVQTKTFVIAILTGPTEDDLRVISVLRGGVTNNGIDWGNAFPSLPSC